MILRVSWISFLRETSGAGEGGPSLRRRTEFALPGARIPIEGFTAVPELVSSET